jgi:hypothetical protein
MRAPSGSTFLQTKVPGMEPEASERISLRKRAPRSKNSTSGRQVRGEPLGPVRIRPPAAIIPEFHPLLDSASFECNHSV